MWNYYHVCSIHYGWQYFRVLAFIKYLINGFSHYEVSEVYLVSSHSFDVYHQYIDDKISLKYWME